MAAFNKGVRILHLFLTVTVPGAVLVVVTASSVLLLLTTTSPEYHVTALSLASPVPRQLLPSSGNSKKVTVRYRARVAYDGNGFSGFQLQTRPNCRTVQGVLETVLNQRLLRRPRRNADDNNNDDDNMRMIKVVAASRTDTGVHARGQAIHFDVPDYCNSADDRNDDESISSNHINPRDKESVEHHPTEDLTHLCESINNMLSPDVRIWNLQLAPTDRITKRINVATGRAIQQENIAVIEDNIATTTTALADFQWNVLFDATEKLYSYRLCLGPVMDPIQRYMRWHPPQAEMIDIDQLRRTLQYFVGTHDFRAFAGAIERSEKKMNMVTTTTSGSLSTIRTVYSVTLHKESEHDDDGNYRIDFRLKGALYKQVRNMVGSAIDVCKGRMSQEYFVQLLHHQPKVMTRADNLSKPAPPQGLTLEMVYFDDPDF